MDIPGDIVKAVAVVVTVVVVVEVVEEMVVVGGDFECGVMVFLEILLTDFTNFK